MKYAAILFSTFLCQFAIASASPGEYEPLYIKRYDCSGEYNGKNACTIDFVSDPGNIEPVLSGFTWGRKATEFDEMMGDTSEEGQELRACFSGPLHVSIRDANGQNEVTRFWSLDGKCRM
jgi:hypothetical protein